MTKKLTKRKSSGTASKTYAPQTENDPTKERVKRAQGIVDDFKTDTGRRVKRLNAILDHMQGHSMIDAHSYNAGKLVFEIFNKSELSLGAVDLSAVRVDGGGDHDPMQRRIDNANKFGEIMRAIGLSHCRAFREMVLHEKPPHQFGFEYYGYKDRASASAVAYSVLKDALHAIDLHVTGGNRPHNAKTRSHMEEGARPTNRPDERAA
jgi:hypothetical protein